VVATWGIDGIEGGRRKEGRKEGRGKVATRSQTGSTLARETTLKLDVEADERRSIGSRGR
jgi:hypothetical protein